MSTATAPPATRTWWRCGNCQTKLGEIVGARLLVVVKGEQFNFPLVPGMVFTCRKCGHPNAYCADTVDS